MTPWTLQLGCHPKGWLQLLPALAILTFPATARVIIIVVFTAFILTSFISLIVEGYLGTSGMYEVQD